MRTLNEFHSSGNTLYIDFEFTALVAMATNPKTMNTFILLDKNEISRITKFATCQEPYTI